MKIFSRNKINPKNMISFTLRFIEIIVTNVLLFVKTNFKETFSVYKNKNFEN